MTSFVHHFLRTNTSQIFLLNGNMKVLHSGTVIMARLKLVERCAFRLKSQSREPMKREWRRNLHIAGSISRKKSFRNEYLGSKESYIDSIKIILSLCLPGEVVLLTQKVPNVRIARVTRVGSDPEF